MKYIDEYSFSTESISSYVEYNGIKYERIEEKVDDNTREITWAVMDENDDTGPAIEQYKHHLGWSKDGVFSQDNPIPELESSYKTLMRSFR